MPSQPDGGNPTSTNETGMSKQDFYKNRSASTQDHRPARALRLNAALQRGWGFSGDRPKNLPGTAVRRSTASGWLVLGWKIGGFPYLNSGSKKFRTPESCLYFKMLRKTREFQTISRVPMRWRFGLQWIKCTKIRRKESVPTCHWNLSPGFPCSRIPPAMKRQARPRGAIDIDAICKCIL